MGKLKVRKRDGSIQDFDINKIRKVVKDAFNTTKETVDESKLNKLLDTIGLKNYDENYIIDIETIQDVVETILMQLGCYRTAKEFILYREKHKQLNEFVRKKKKFISNYIESDNTANATIDDNSNVSNHNIAVLNSEIHKEENQEINYRMLRDKLKELYPDFDYKQMDRDFNTIAYLHDSSSQIGMPYCVAITMYPFLLNGIKDLGGLSVAPKNIDSFCGMFVNLVFAIASQFKGACLYKNQELLINDKFIKIKDFISKFNLSNKFISDNSEWEYADIQGDNYYIQEEKKPVKILKVYRRKYSDKIYSINSKTGLHCNVSKDHKFKVIRKGIIEEVKAEDLKLYDTVFVNKDISNILDTNSIEYKRNFCLGMLLGDGCLSKENSVILSITYGQEYYFDIFNSYSKEVFGNTLNLNKGHKCWNAQKYNKEYKDSIMKYLLGSKTVDKNIKPEYLQTINEYCGFLDGLMATDGSYRHSFGISLINKGLIENCVKTLKILNIPYSLKTIPAHNNKQELYELSFSGCSYIYLPNFIKKCPKEITTRYVYYLSNNAKKYTTGELNAIDSTRRGKTALKEYELDVITDISTFDNDDEYVYEIETSTHWYNCGGFITHNCATPGMLLCMDYFLRKEWGDNYYNLHNEVISGKLCNRQQTIKGQIHQYFQQIVYSLMQPCGARGNQSVFWNLSIFDKPFFDTMYGEFYFPDGTRPNWESFNWLQKDFLHWLNQERLKCILTFPVVSLCLIYQEGKFLDEDLYKFACQEYAEGNSFFTYISDSADSLSSCCRLSSKIEKPQFNFTNGQLSEMTGSKNVITLNLNRITQDYFKTVDTNYFGASGILYKDITEEDMQGFREYLINILERVYKYQISYNECLKYLKESGLLPVYNAGFINMNKQYLTIGINGLNQAWEFLGGKCNKNKEYEKFCNLIFTTIKEQNQKHKTKELMFNTEFTPCESAAIKLYNRDKNDGYWVPEDTNLYASYIFKPNDKEISILDKIYLHGRTFCGDNLDGGSAAHLNLDSHLSVEQYKKILKYAAEVGCKYFTFNIPNCECKDCGFIAKQPFDKCPKCGSTNISLWDRVIGYLTEIKNWSKGRQIEQKTRVYSNGKEEIK